MDTLFFNQREIWSFNTVIIAEKNYIHTTSVCILPFWILRILCMVIIIIIIVWLLLLISFSIFQRYILSCLTQISSMVTYKCCIVRRFHMYNGPLSSFFCVCIMLQTSRIEAELCVRIYSRLSCHRWWQNVGEEEQRLLRFSPRNGGFSLASNY